MPQMIRKQVYIYKRHEALLKKLATLRRVSQAELIREAIDRQAERSGTTLIGSDSAAGEEAVSFMKALHRRGPVKGRRRGWTREDAYADRIG